MVVIHTSGKRKTAVARATLSSGKGRVQVNKIPLAVYATRQLRLKINEPLLLIGKKAEKVDVQVSVHGGGVTSQADAARLAIGRALASWDETLKQTLEDYDRLLLVADVRRKETCKPNVSKARAKRQKSYR